MEAVKSTSSFTLKLKQYISLNSADKKITSSIDFYLPYDSKINLAILDGQGNIAQKVVEDEYLRSGQHSKNIDLRGLPAGDYFYSLETDKNREVKSLKLSKKSIK